MSDLVKWLLKRFGLVGALAMLLVGTASADHCYPGGYCQPNYGHSYGYQPNYAPKYYNTWSRWEYTKWNVDPCYYVYFRSWYDHCGKHTNYHDGWLYVLEGNGCYRKHCLISGYASKPQLTPTPCVEKYGGTQLGYDHESYVLVKKHPFLYAPGVIAAKDLPYASSPQDFLAPYESTAALRVELAHKSEMSTKDYALRIFQQESDKEARQEEVRGKLAILAETGRQDERMFAEFKEFLAVRRGQALIDANTQGQKKVPVDDPGLAQTISTSCLRCHGGGKVEGDIDFTKADQFTLDQKYAAFTSVLTGEMPKGGTALSREQSDHFRKWYEDSLLASRR